VLLHAAIPTEVPNASDGFILGTFDDTIVCYVWCAAHGVLRMVCYTWLAAYGLLHMVHYIRCAAYGVLHMVCCI
jgi:hypothetical protein